MPTRKAWAVVILATLAPGPRAGASGVDGAGNIVVVPLVVSGPSGESVVTMTNAGPESLEISSTYVGAEGTPNAASRVGEITCRNQTLPPWGSVTLSLRDLCGLPEPNADSADFGYLDMTSRGDASTTFFAVSEVRTRAESFGIDGVPAGAFDPGFAPGLRVRGLRAPGSGESIGCYVGTLSDGKSILLELLDGATSSSIGATVVNLGTRRMERVDGTRLGLKSGTMATNLWVRISGLIPLEPGLVIAGCALERRSAHGHAYQPAQTAAPHDSARLRETRVEASIVTGPYGFGANMGCTSASGPCSKVTLSTYLRWDDTLRCRLDRPDHTPYNGSGDPSPWYELQIRHPDGTVVAGGDNVNDTGYFRTGRRGSAPSSVGQRWLVEISLNEASVAAAPWPFKPGPGYWGLACESAAGMSEPIPVPLQATPDDF